MKTKTAEDKDLVILHEPTDEDKGSVIRKIWEPPLPPLKDKLIQLGDQYIGLFVGFSKAYNTIVDHTGFANWGMPGWSVDYNDSKIVGGFLIGQKVEINGVPAVRFELDATVGNMSASTNQLDPEGLDETASADMLWLVTARVGLEKDIKIFKLVVNYGLAAARFTDRVYDIDYGKDIPPYHDPDDSFHNDSIRLGSVFGVGLEWPFFPRKNKWQKLDTIRYLPCYLCRKYRLCKSLWQ